MCANSISNSKFCFFINSKGSYLLIRSMVARNICCNEKTKVNEISKNMFENPLSCKTWYTYHQYKSITFSQTKRKSLMIVTLTHIVTLPLMVLMASRSGCMGRTNPWNSLLDAILILSTFFFLLLFSMFIVHSNFSI